MGTAQCRRIWFAVMLVVAAWCSGAGAEPGVAPHATRAARGLAGVVEVAYEADLRAKASQTPVSEVMVRVAPGTKAGVQRIEFVGAVAGEFDLRDYVERVDGRAMTGLAPIPVIVESSLPAGHGTDLFGSSESAFTWRTHYRGILWGGAVLWVAVPIVVLAVRAARRPAPTPHPEVVRQLTLEDQLREAIEVARDRPLTVQERGRLELLVMRVLTGGGGDTDRSEPQSVALAIAAARQEPGTRDLVLAVERWLHSPEGGAAAHGDATAALEAFRRSRLETPVVEAPGAGVAS